MFVGERDPVGACKQSGPARGRARQRDAGDDIHFQLSQSASGQNMRDGFPGRVCLRRRAFDVCAGQRSPADRRDKHDLASSENQTELS